MNKINILLAEDSEMFRTMFRDTLIRRGFNVVTAVDGLDAWEKIKRSPEDYDLLLLDIEMPKLDGFGLLSKFKSNESKMPLPPTLILTATQPKPQTLSELRQMGARGYIVKSQDEKEIIFRIKSITSKGENRRKDSRELLSIPMEYSLAGSFIRVKSFDFSDRGAYIATTNPVDVGKTIQLRFKVPTSKQVFEPYAKVMFVIKMDSNKKGSYPPGMGIQFTGLSDREKQAITGYINFARGKQQ